MHHSDFLGIIASIKKPNVYVELGLYNGETLLKVINNCNKVYGVDLKSNERLSYLENMYKDKLTIFYEKTSVFFTHFSGKIDMAFIDADHKYESVLTDFNNILNLLSDDGIIFLHDTDQEDNKLFNHGDSYRIVKEFEKRSDINIITLPLTEAWLSIVMKKNSSRTYLRNLPKKKGWLVNDRLTCIPGTITFLHKLLDWIPNIEDKTNVYTDFSILAEVIENDIRNTDKKPDYIIRNGTYFRKLNIDTHLKTIVLIQDIFIGHSYFNNQLETINDTNTIVVFNSNYVYNKYKPFMTHTNYKVIPIGIDFDLFRPISTKHPEVLSNSILYIGSILNYPKGFDRVLKIVNNMPEQNFCFIMKDDFKIDHHRIKVFNKIDSNTVVSIINSCICAICTSREETQHLSGIECGACDIPIVATSVGMYDDIKDSQEWGLIADDTNFVDKINYVIQNRTQFKPRSFFEKQYTYEISKNNWIELIDSI